MSDYFSRYSRRLKRTGNDVGEAYSNNTVSFINKNFHASPTFRRMGVISSHHPEITEMDARVVEIERLGTLREVILRPTESLEVGMYVVFDGDTWLLIDKYGGTGSTSIKMLAIKVNQKLKWKDENGEIREFHCVSSATDLGSKAKQSKNEIEWNKYDVRLPIGQLFVSVEHNEYTEKVSLNNRFIFGRNVYEVTGIDDITNVDNDGQGIIQYTVRITTKRTEDDFETGLAYNIFSERADDSIESTSSIQTANADKKNDNGGRLW